MADADLELDRMGGRFNAEQGQILTAADVDRIGAFGIKSLCNLLSLLFWDEANGVPLSGFPRDLLSTDFCETTSTGDLSFEVSTGWGMFYNASATADDFEPTKYLPVVLDTLYEGDLSAHHATHPRIDLVCISPAWESDVPETRNVKDPGTGVVSSTSIDARRRFSSAIQIVTGTAAATPAVPSVPAGYMEIARAYVPAVSGAAVWKDHRQVLEFGHLFKGLPRHAVDNYVPLGGSDELAVSQLAAPGLAVIVERGRAVINGVARLYKRETSLTITAAHATLHRIDLVVANQDGTLSVTAGTPHATPTAPAVPTNTCPLAEVYVAATDTTIVDANITDRRQREPFNGELRLQAESVTSDRLVAGGIDGDRLAAGTVAGDRLTAGTVSWEALETPGVYVHMGTVTGSGDHYEIPIELFHPDRVTEYAGPFDTAGDPDECVFVAEAYLYVNGGTLNAVDYPNADAAFTGTPDTELSSMASSGDLYRLWFEPASGSEVDFNQGGGPSKTSLVFWMESRTGTLHIERKAGSAATKYKIFVRPLNRPGGSRADGGIVVFI